MINSIDYLNTFDITSFFNNSKSIICFKINVHGTVMFANEAYRTILKYEEKNIEANLQNPTLEDLVNIKDDHIIFDGILTLRKGEGFDSFYTKVSRSGDLFTFICEYNSAEIEMLYSRMSSNSTQINNMNRELIKTQFTLKNTIQELKDTQAMLIHSEKMNALGQLVAGVAHEINNPMAFVTGNIQVFEDYAKSIKDFITDISVNCDDKFEELKKQYDIDYILSDILSLQEATLGGANRVNTIVAQLRDFSKIDTLECLVCNLKECIDSAVVIANPEIVKQRIRLDLKLEDTTDIECYPAQLNQVFLNLIINAVQAIEEEGVITISLYEDDTTIFVKIEDDGCGILDEHISKIYDAFFTTKPPGKGVGLGLNMVYRSITELHQGEVIVESLIDHGTTFTIALPKNKEV